MHDGVGPPRPPLFGALGGFARTLHLQGSSENEVAGWIRVAVAES